MYTFSFIILFYTNNFNFYYYLFKLFSTPFTKYWIFIKKAFSSATALKNTGNSSNVKQLPYDLTVPLMYPKRNENMSTQVCSVKYYVQWTLEQHGAWRLGVLALCTMRPNWNIEVWSRERFIAGPCKQMGAHALKALNSPKGFNKAFFKATCGAEHRASWVAGSVISLCTVLWLGDGEITWWCYRS